jgi:hypothetical protein
VQANAVDALAVGFGTVLTGGIGAKAMQLSMDLKTMAGKVLGNAAGWFAAGSFFETALQYGLTQVYQITQGASGQEDINWSSVLTAGGVGGVLGGADTKLAYSENFNQGVDFAYRNPKNKKGAGHGLTVRNTDVFPERTPGR